MIKYNTPIAWLEKEAENIGNLIYKLGMEQSVLRDNISYYASLQESFKRAIAILKESEVEGVKDD